MATLAEREERRLKEEREQRQEKEAQLRKDFADKLYMNCRLLVTHFEDLMDAAKIGQQGGGGDEGGSDGSGTGGSSGGGANDEVAAAAAAAERALRFGEQERIRRDGLHVAVHAESLSNVGQALLGQIQDLRMNLVMGDADGIAKEIAASDAAAAAIEASGAASMLIEEVALEEGGAGQDAGGAAPMASS